MVSFILTDQQILQSEKLFSFLLHIQDFITAATDTTAGGIEWALAELMNHPKVLEKARQEIDKVVGTNSIVQESDTANLPYIKAVIKETLRLHPPIPVVSRKIGRAHV